MRIHFVSGFSRAPWKIAGDDLSVPKDGYDFLFRRSSLLLRGPWRWTPACCIFLRRGKGRVFHDAYRSRGL